MEAGLALDARPLRMAIPMDIEALADAAAAGDVDAFERLVREHQSRVLNVAYRMLNDAHDAEDVCQDVFVKAFRALPRLRDRSQFSAWLLKITANCSRDYLRRRRRRGEVPLEEVSTPIIDERHTESEGARDTERIVQRLLMGLPEKHRIVIVLRDIEGMSYEEMARVLVCTVSSVKNRLHRARRVFRERLAPYLGEDGGLG
jgi:RNA polymerase sigma-70 factor, ECF subfamily